MLQTNRVVASMMTLMLAVAIPCANVPGQAKDAKRVESFDPVEFMKSFRIGMSYAEVQRLLPRHAEQDALAYVPSEEAFLLGVDISGQTTGQTTGQPTRQPTWSASFKFDTMDTPARRPEQLIEFSCSAGLSSRSETFETIVKKVTAAFGDPLEVDGSREQFRQAGWRVSGGSVLTLEYSTMTGALANDVNIEFVIKKNPRRALPDPKAVA
jgi:hypothetical protein